MGWGTNLEFFFEKSLRYHWKAKWNFTSAARYTSLRLRVRSGPGKYIWESSAYRWN